MGEDRIADQTPSSAQPPAPASMTPGALPSAPDRQDGVASAPPLTPAQEVGAGLQAARVSRGYSLESVCQHTRIPRKFLAALEAGRFEDLPAPVYLRSFLADYCEYLELDLQPLWDRLHPAPVIVAPSAVASPEGVEPGAPSAPQPSPYLNAIVSARQALVLSLALALGLAWWAARGSPAGPAAGLQPPGPALPGWQGLSGLARSALEPKLVLACRDDAWVSVKADGVVLFAGRLPKNASQQFQAHQLILLRASAPEDLILSLNGAPYRLPRPDDNGEYRIESP
jgi:hypothetical protein